MKETPVFSTVVFYDEVWKPVIIWGHKEYNENTMGDKESNVDFLNCIKNVQI